MPKADTPVTAARRQTPSSTRHRPWQWIRGVTFISPIPITTSSGRSRRMVSSPRSRVMAAWVTRGDGGPATSAALSQPNAVAVDLSGALYISDGRNSRLRTVSPAGVIATFTTVEHALSLAADSVGDLYVIDYRRCIYPHLCPFLEKVNQDGVYYNLNAPGF